MTISAMKDWKNNGISYMHSWLKEKSLLTSGNIKVVVLSVFSVYKQKLRKYCNNLHIRKHSRITEDSLYFISKKYTGRNPGIYLIIQNLTIPDLLATSSLIVSFDNFSFTAFVWDKNRGFPAIKYNCIFSLNRPAGCGYLRRNCRIDFVSNPWNGPVSFHWFHIPCKVGIIIE